MNPVAYSVLSQALVDAYDARPKEEKTADYWSDAAIAAVKKEIKDHYIAEQLRRCAYCDHQIITDNNMVWDGEHIISKKNNPEFMFEPRNLAISCKDCNSAKSDQEVRLTKKAAFPTTSPEYKIVHPHFDAYGEHIGWFNEIVFAKSRDKGSATIAMCNLTRYSAMTIGETENIMDKRFTEIAGKILKVENAVDVDIVAAAIKALLESKNAS